MKTTKQIVEAYMGGKAEEVGEDIFAEMSKLIDETKLDAMKEGMRRAAEIGANTTHERAVDYLAGNNVRQAILTAAEQLTLKDLP